MSMSIKHVNDHESWLMATVPYTDDERAQVQALFEQERTAIRTWRPDNDVNLTGIQFGVANERRGISRAARRRGCANGLLA